MLKEIYGKKIGMTQVFREDGDLVAVTLIEVEPVCVLEKVRSGSKEKVRIGCFKLKDKKIKKIKKPLLGYFNKLKVSPYKFVREVEILQSSKDEKLLGTSQQIGGEIFKEGDIVEVRAKTKGRGFAGGVKRYGWAGQPRSHGSTSHRRIGSAGASAYPSRIIKGLHMPGHMGNAFRTIKNLKVFKVDKDKGIVLIEGSIPGSRGSIVKLKKNG